MTGPRTPNAAAVQVKAKAVLRGRGYNGDSVREYCDWHIEIRAGLSYVSVWTSAGMVFLSMSDIPVYYRPGSWEQYLDLLFQRTRR